MSDQRQRALELYLAGTSYRRIMQTLDYETLADCHEGIAQALEEIDAQDYDLTQSQLARLDVLRTSQWAAARKGDTQALLAILKIDERYEHLHDRLVEPTDSPDVIYFQNRMIERWQRQKTDGER